jgi:hypothetical protein
MTQTHVEINGRQSAADSSFLNEHQVKENKAISEEVCYNPTIE